MDGYPSSGSPAERGQQLVDLKRAIDHAAIVATTDVTGRFTYVNDEFCGIVELGHPAGAIGPSSPSSRPSRAAAASG